MPPLLAPTFDVISERSELVVSPTLPVRFLVIAALSSTALSRRSASWSCSFSRPAFCACSRASGFGGGGFGCSTFFSGSGFFSSIFGGGGGGGGDFLLEHQLDDAVRDLRRLHHGAARGTGSNGIRIAKIAKTMNALRTTLRKRRFDFLGRRPGQVVQTIVRSECHGELHRAQLISDAVRAWPRRRRRLALDDGERHLAVFGIGAGRHDLAQHACTACCGRRGSSLRAP